jgi:hypothetical protein
MNSSTASCNEITLFAFDTCAPYLLMTIPVGSISRRMWRIFDDGGPVIPTWPGMTNSNVGQDRLPHILRGSYSMPVMTFLPAVMMAWAM